MKDNGKNGNVVLFRIWNWKYNYLNFKKFLEDNEKIKKYLSVWSSFER